MNYSEIKKRNDQNSRLKYQIGKLRATDIFRKTSFYFNRAKRGKVYNVYEKDALDFANQMDVLLTFLKENYEENFDIYPDPIFNDRGCKYFIKLVLKYPFLTITNSEDNLEKHNIEDLFIVFNVNYFPETSGITLNDMQGFRTSLSFAEVSSRYVHSHLSQVNKFNTQTCMNVMDFCLGESDFSYVLTNMASEPITKEYLELFKFSLEGVLETESEEGVPYMHFRSVSDANGGNTEIQMNTSDPSSQNLSDIYNRYLIPNIIKQDINFDFKYVDGQVKIVENDTLYQTIKKAILDYIFEYNEDFKKCLWKCFEIKSYDGSVSAFRLPPKVEIEDYSYHQSEDAYYYFRDQKIYFNITDIGEYNIETEQREYDLEELLEGFTSTPIILNDLKKRIHEKIQKELVKRNARESQLINT